ncbi:hypothetical protein [Streptomyces guryensis]|uniref:VWFA domain-containing protein n=1 Tax=Streptomyces guryensis TaxID=2886947 RepID=A0A9Q3VYI7_9ACTN|nr:hypothetical protein [Streptomyces guryensis]MCD9879845.1 hypothetical protein [Streptomyces guryensis]
MPYDTTLFVHVDEPDLVPDKRVPGASVKLLAQLKVAVFDQARGEHADPGQLALIIALDVADHRRERMVAAVRDALTAMPSGASFAVVTAGAERGGGPVRYYPAGPGSWAPADRQHRISAAFAMGAAPLAADGVPRSFGYDGWLAEARRLFAGCDRTLCRLLLVTDGSTGYEDASLTAQLAACGAEFSCEVIAVGNDWDYQPLERIAGRLRGTADAAGPDFAAALAAAVRRACRRAVPALPLEVTVRPGVRIESFVQFTPEHLELAADPPSGPYRHVFPTLPWDPAGVTSEFLLALRADGAGDRLGEELQFAMVSLGSLHEAVTARWRDPRLPPAPTASRTNDETTGESSRLLDSRHRMIMHFRRGLEALRGGQRAAAESHLGQAAAGAHQLAEGWMLNEIGGWGDIHDAAAGSVSVRLPADAHRVSVALLRLGARSASRGTSRTAGRQRPAGPCPACAEPAVPGALHCVRCGEELS